MKLPYSLNVISEAVAALALENRAVRDANVALIIEERKRMLMEMRAIPNVLVYPDRANFIAFRSRATFDDFLGAASSSASTAPLSARLRRYAQPERRLLSALQERS